MKTLFLGDVCPCKYGVELFKTGDLDKIFGDVRNITDAKDFVCVNLECAITESTDKIRKFGPNLAAPLETADVLRRFGVNLCGLSNNHSFDLGIKGIEDTITALGAAGVDYTGWGDNYEDSRKNYYFEKDGEKICIIAVCEHEYSYALENRMGARPYDEYDTIEDIRAAKENANRVIVLYHGGKEFSAYPSPRLHKLCHAMARAGADLILCQHSHCIGCYEEYDECHILYGQGNFHFLDPDPREGWYTELAVEYDTKTGKISFIPLRTTDYYISLAKGEDAKSIMDAFEKRSEELQNGEWKLGWHAFCDGMRDRYIEAIGKAGCDNSTEIDNAYFGHMLDCEAHTDVWRELFPTWNQTNCID